MKKLGVIDCKISEIKNSLNGSNRTLYTAEDKISDQSIGIVWFETQGEKELRNKQSWA